MRSLRHAIRTLTKTPYVTFVAVLSLSLGIGANSATFSLFDQFLLRYLPVERPGELVNLGAPGPKPGSQSCTNAGGCELVFSYPMFRDLEGEQSVLSGLAAHRIISANLAYQGETVSGDGLLVSGRYFETLGVEPALGRLIGPDDDRTEGSHFVAVLSHAYWRDRFGARADVIGEILIVNAQPMTVIGVAPPGFTGTTLGDNPELFVPLTMTEVLSPGWEVFDNRRSYWVYLFGRLDPGTSIEQARAGLNVPYTAIVNEVEAELQSGMSDETMERFRTKALTVEPGGRGQSSFHRVAGPPLTLLVSVTGIVLLIACANIANLLLARGAMRETEMAVRLSMGASRRRVIAQLLVESCLLGVLGALGGILVAGWTLRLIAALLPAEMGLLLATELDWRPLLYTAVLGIGTGVLFGLFPALYSTRPDLVSALGAQSGRLAGGRGASRFRHALATAQVALAMALLISAGLFTKSLVNVSRVDLGLSSENLVTFGISPTLNGYTPLEAMGLYERVETELAATAGIDAAVASMVPLIAGSSWGTNVTVEGFEAGPDTDTNTRFNEVGPGFFRTLAVPLLTGREFTPSDTRGSPRVAVVNEAFARKFGLGREAVGRRLAIGRSEELDIEIVGLVQDAKYSDVKREAPPQLFLPYRQNDEIARMFFYARAAGAIAPERLIASLRALMSRIDPNLPLEHLQTMDDQVRENVFADRLITTLSATFAVLATLLAAVGLYGVLAYTIAQRTNEIGIRMALGADRKRVRRLVLGQVGRMTVLGGAFGLLAAVALGRTAQSLLFEMGSHDPVVLSLAVVLLGTVAFLAGWVPALRASRIDPIRALRYE